jgi:hypothetical protein
MADEPLQQTALGDVAARQLPNATKTAPQMGRITPRWLTHLLQWIPVEAGIYRLNRVKDESRVTVDCSDRDERVLPQTYVDYEEHPREYMLSAVNTVVDIHTRVSDLYSVPYNQITEQLRLTIEIIKERQESELINNREYGLLHNVAEKQRIKTRKGPPTPDDLDELISRVWKEPGFFLAHPATIGVAPVDQLPDVGPRGPSLHAAGIVKKGRSIVIAVMKEMSQFAIIALLWCVPAWGHHASVFTYDVAKAYTVRVVATEFEYANPHPQLRFDQKDERGIVTHWVGEIQPSPGQLARLGWDRKRSVEALAPGTEVTITIAPARFGQPLGLVGKIEAKDGELIFGFRGFGKSLGNPGGPARGSEKNGDE